MRSHYVSPIEERYNDIPMSTIFSEAHKYVTWRRLWVALAEAEKECGFPISDEQIAEMRKHVSTIDMDRAREIENETHHDVMAHVKAFAEQCPTAAPIIHLGATSCYVTDNTDMLQMMEGLLYIRKSLVKVMHMLLVNADAYKETDCIAYTHFQPAQPTTVGKRFATWASDIRSDVDALDYELEHLEFLGCKGAVGTSASFLSLFDGDTTRVFDLDKIIAEKMGFPRVVEVSGQTYSRKQDFNILQVLSRIAQSASKFATDIRLLSHTGEIREGFGSKQVGSSAMPYKQNPVDCEQITGLCRYVISSLSNAAITASTQWLERSLDDSSNRRILIPEMFILTQHILNTYERVLSRVVINREKIKGILHEKEVDDAFESIMMVSVRNGGDRQKTHEALRDYMLNGDGGPLYEYIKDRDGVNISLEEVYACMAASRSGVACWQTLWFARKYHEYGKQR